MDLSKFFKNGFLVLASFAITIVAVEFVLRGLWGEPIRYRLTPAQEDIQTDFSVTYGIDSRGLRKICQAPGQDSKKLVFIGDSFTFGQGVTDQENFVYQLSCTLPQYDFYNFGSIGRGFAYYQAVLEQLVPEDTSSLFLILFDNDVMINRPHSLRKRIQMYLVRYTQLGSLIERSKQNVAGRAGSEDLQKNAALVDGRLNNPKSIFSKAPYILEKWTAPEGKQLTAYQEAFDEFLQTFSIRFPDTVLFVTMIPEASIVSATTRDFYTTVGAKFLPPFRTPSVARAKTMALCQKPHCHFIDLFPHFVDGDQYYFPRDLHWNAAGHRKMYEVLKPIIEDLEA
jgi:hypothetical protein